MLVVQKQGQEYGQVELTLSEHLDRWLENYASNHYAHKTFESYKGILNFDVRPTVGHIMLTQLKPAHIQQVLNVMKERGNCSNTRRRLYSVFSTLLDSAVEWGSIEQNPAAQVKIPRREAKEMRRGLKQDSV
jgi:site-specific recombinase XerC